MANPVKPHAEPALICKAQEQRTVVVINACLKCVKKLSLRTVGFDGGNPLQRLDKSRINVAAKYESIPFDLSRRWPIDTGYTQQDYEQRYHGNSKVPVVVNDQN